MVIRASTNVFTAGPEPPGPAGTFAVAGLVSRASVTPLTFSVTDALPVTCPADCDVNVIVHWPLIVPADAQLSPETWFAAPLLLASVTVGLVPFGTLTNPLPS